MKYFAIRSIVAAAALLASSLAQAETLTLSTPDPDSSEITVAANKFAELVSAKTNGELTVKVFPNGTLYGGDPSGAVKQLAGGSLDMLVLATSLYANFNPKFSAISIPYLFDDEAQLRGYLAGEQGKELIADLDKIGIKGINLWPRPFRQMTNSKRPIEKPDDLAGLKFRVPNNPLWVEFFGKLGAVPRPWPLRRSTTPAAQGRRWAGKPDQRAALGQVLRSPEICLHHQPHGRWMGSGHQPGQV